MRRTRATSTAALVASVVISLVAALLTTAAASATTPVPFGGPGASTAIRAVDAGASGVEITTVTPVVTAPREPVTITGMLDVAELGIDLTPAPTESATDPPSDDSDEEETPEPPVATVEVRAAPRPIRTHPEVAAWATSTTPSEGRILTSEPISAPSNTAAARLPFTVTIPDLSRSISATYGVVPVSLQVYLPGETAPVRVVHTFLGYQAIKEYVPLALTMIVPFVIPADAQLLGAFGDDRLAAWEGLVGDDGVLRHRLDRATGPGVAWAIDPALLSPGPGSTPDPPPDDTEDAPATTSPDESETANPTEEPTAGETATDEPATDQATPDQPAGGPDAREAQVREAYATAVLDASRGVDVLLLPQHDGDLAVLPPQDENSAGANALRAVLGDDLDVSAARERLEEAGAKVQQVVWPVSGRWDRAQDAALRELAGGDGWGVLLPLDAISGTPSGPVTSPDGTTLLGVDTDLSRSASTGSTGRITDGLTVMADTLITLNERPGSSRHHLITLDRYATSQATISGLTDVLDEVPWVSLEALPDPAGTGTLVDEPADAETDSAAPLPTLTGNRARELARTEERLLTPASVRVDSGPDLATRGADALNQLSSARWRAEVAEWDLAYEPIADTVDSTFTSLRIPSRDISFLADSGVLRVAVENSLGDGIRNAVLELTVDHPILRIESGPQPVDVAAGSRSTVGFEASAIASGRVSVTAVIRAADGTALSEPSTFEVRVSPTAEWIYWVLGALAGVVIVIGVIRTAMRRHPKD